MTSFWSRSAPRLFVLTLALSVFPVFAPAQAQTARSVVQEMKNTYLAQFGDIDTYVVETDLYTSYHRKTDSGNGLEFESATQMKGQSQTFTGMGTATQGQFDQFDKIGEHGRHMGMETVNGTSCHVLRVDDPSKIDGRLGDNAESLTYYVSASDYLPRRMEFRMKPQPETPTPQMVSVDLNDYQTVSGLTLPWRMEMKTNLNESMSPQQKQQLQEMKKQMEQMDEEQRKMMKRMMGDQMKQLERMMAGEPTVITVQNVTVNQPLPDGVFGSN